MQEMGYVYFSYFRLGPHGPIYICELAFHQSGYDKPKSLYELAVTLIHEAAHRVGWILDDSEYFNFSFNRVPTNTTSLDTDDAVNNADSYAQFARLLFGE